MKELRINEKVVIPASDLSVSFVRSSGPGGQNVNKVATKVRLRFAVGETSALPEAWRSRAVAKNSNRLDSNGNLVVVSDRYRDQHRNLDDARSRLRDLLLESQKPPKRRRRTKPTAGSVRRRLEAKRQKSEKKRLRGSPPLP